MSDYEGNWQDNHRICARLSQREQKVIVRKRTVSTDRYSVSTPATHTRNFLAIKAAMATPGELLERRRAMSTLPCSAPVRRPWMP